jgi:hypothetical protein
MADYEAINQREGKFPARKGRTATKSDKVALSSGLSLELTRKNHIYAERESQMRINALAMQGGREYVKKRLSRFSGESKIDWEGGTRPDGITVTGRRQQSHCFPYPRRIADKINQYVFSEEPEREGIDDAVLMDASADGKSMNDLMRDANDWITSCGWCWLGVDAPAVDGQVSQAQKDAAKIRPYVQVYSPLSVVDWKFSSIGGLEWLITESEYYESTTPDACDTEYKVRRIWTAGMVRTVKMQEVEGKMTAVSDSEQPISYSGVPFVLVGKLCEEGHPFDDIESVNRTIMDLESVNRANFFKQCYPQMVLPVSVVQNAQDAYSSQGLGVTELIVGMNYPILVSKDDPAPFYLMPSASDLGAIRTELESLKRNMFDSVGLMLANESRQVASAEAKAWDFQDIAQVMSARAEILEDAENKVAEIINEWDSSISAWAAVYNRDFDVGDFNQEMQALIMTVNTSMPAEMYRMVLNKILDRMDRLGSALTPKQKQAVQDAIAEYEPNAISVSSPFNDFQATP